MSSLAKTSQSMPITADQTDAPEVRGGTQASSLAALNPAERLYRHASRLSWRYWAFFIVVVFPTILTAIYMQFIAADQYVAEFKFNIRGAGVSSNRGGGPSLPIPGANGLDASVVWDSHSVVQYIRSVSMVDALQSRIEFRKIYANERADWYARLDPRLPIEDVAKYWQRMVDPFFDLTTGVVTVKVRAFAADDAANVATTVLELAEELINNLSARSRRDSVKFAEESLRTSERNLRDSQIALREFRNKFQVLNPPKQAEITGALQGKLREELATLRTQADALRAYLSPDSAALRVLQSRIRALEDELNLQQGQLTQPRSGGGTNVLSAVLTDYESLQLEQTFREKAYAVSLEALRNAQMEAERQQVYLNAIVRPRTPEEPLYPQRIRSIIVIFFGGFFAWIIGTLLVYAVRDHIT